MSYKIPATVITGFLGAGKTSVIKHLLANARGKRIALIINEFGECGIDGEILRGCGVADCEANGLVELTNGCICCTVADDFVPTLEALLRRPQPPEHIVIETSGLALPKPLVKAFNWPEIRTRVTVDGVVTVVDARAVADGQFASDPVALQAQREADDALDHESPLEELFEEQLGCADLVVLNKTDLLDEATTHRVRAGLQSSVRPSVKLVRAAHGGVDPCIALGLDAAAESDLASRPSHHDDGEPHDHDDFISFDVELAEVDSPGTLLATLHHVLAMPGILRVKGFAAVAGKDMRLLVQAVGQRIEHYYDRDWRGGEKRTTRLVVIGETGVDEKAIRGGLATLRV